MTNYIITSEESKKKKAAAEILCNRINTVCGYRVADPAWHPAMENRRAYYTGGVELSERGAAEISGLLEARTTTASKERKVKIGDVYQDTRGFTYRVIRPLDRWSFWVQRTPPYSKSTSRRNERAIENKNLLKMDRVIK